MSSMNRTIEGEVLVRRLTRDEWMIDPVLLAEHGRSGRTLVKDGPLRLTVIAVAPGGVLPAHSTDGGPITIHVLDGAILVEALGRDYPLGTGDLVALAPGVEHSVRSASGGVFLLTVVHEPSAGSRLLPGHHAEVPAKPTDAEP